MVIDGPIGRIAATVTLILGLGACDVQTASLAASASAPVATGAPPASVPPTAAPSAAIATPSPSAAAVATPTPSHEVGTWTLDATVPDFSVGDVVAADDGLIAVGCRAATDVSTCSGAAIAMSGPIGWTSVAVGDSVGEIFLAAVASGPRGYVAVGHERGPGVDSNGNQATTAVAFASSDGTTWRRAPDGSSLHDRRMKDVVALPGGEWLAVGDRAGVSVYAGFETWSSADGLTWKLIDSKEEVDVLGVTLSGDGPIAWGDGCTDACALTPLFIWTSPDGTDWALTRNQPSLAAAEIGDMVGLPGGAVAVGTQVRAEIPAGTVWRKEAAARWPRVALPGAAEHVTFALAAGERGFVTVGGVVTGDDIAWKTWTSTDGATWTPLPTAGIAAGTMPRFPRPALAADGDSFVLIGGSESSPDASVFRLWLE